MSSIPDDRRYAETHEWVRLVDGVAIVGISAHAAAALTDLVIVDYCKEVGEDIEKDEEFGEVESVKASEPVISPIPGVVTAVNDFEDEERLKLISESPYEEGWLIKIKPRNVADIDALLDAAGYRQYLDSEA